MIFQQYIHDFSTQGSLLKFWVNPTDEWLWKTSVNLIQYCHILILPNPYMDTTPSSDSEESSHSNVKESDDWLHTSLHFNWDETNEMQLWTYPVKLLNQTTRIPNLHIITMRNVNLLPLNKLYPFSLGPRPRYIWVEKEPDLANGPHSLVSTACFVGAIVRKWLCLIPVEDVVRVMVLDFLM